LESGKIHPNAILSHLLPEQTCPAEMQLEAGPSSGLPRGRDVLVKGLPGEGLGEGQREVMAPEIALQRLSREGKNVLYSL